MSTAGKILFLSYDGMTDPLGQSQVLSYLEGLSRLGHKIYLISFEKPDAFAKTGDVIRERVLKSSIKWHPLGYTKKPPVLSTLYDLYKGWGVVKLLQKEENFDIVHCRGYITAVIGRKMKKRFGTKFIFDMRGWWADEKMESGLWNSSVYIPVYRFLKKLEKSFFAESEITVSLTEAGKEEIMNVFKKQSQAIPVIPTCVNFNYFPPFNAELKKRVREELGIVPNAKILIYSGSLGGNYNIDTLFKIYEGLWKLNSGWRLLVLTKTDRAFIFSSMSGYGFDKNNVFVTEAEYKDVSKYLMAGDAGLIFYNKSYSVIGRCPTKMGEYLSAGLPILSIEGIGDLDYLLKRFPESGYLLQNIATEDYKMVSELLLKLSENKSTLRNYALEYFNLANGVEAYNLVYQQLLH